MYTHTHTHTVECVHTHTHTHTRAHKFMHCNDNNCDNLLNSKQSSVIIIVSAIVSAIVTIIVTINCISIPLATLVQW